jgi:hypothetical protein
MPSRAEFKTLANKRLDEAKALQQAGHYEAAFYLAGYAVECGLKAAVCKTLQIDIFDMPTDLHKGFKTHRLDHLIVLSGLSKQLAEDIAADTSLSLAASPFLTPPLDFEGWQSWSEQVRYNVIDCPEQVLQEFVSNVDYFMSWLRNHW